MKARWFILGNIFILLLYAGAPAQNSLEIDQRYGAVKLYQVRPLSLMLPWYAANGQICRAEIFPNHNSISDDILAVPRWPEPVSGERFVFDVFKLDIAELKSICDEFAPSSMRQGKGKASLEMYGFGGAYWTTLRYTNVAFRVEVALLRGGQHLDMSAAHDNLDSFLKPPFGEIIGARIEWTDRTCIELPGVSRGSVDSGDVDL